MAQSGVRIDFRTAQVVVVVMISVIGVAIPTGNFHRIRDTLSLSGISPSTSSSVLNAGWPFQMENQQNTGYSSQTIVNASSVAGLNLLWFDNFGGLAGTPVVSGGNVYVSGGSSITAVSEASGQLIWRDGPSGQTGLTYHTRVGVTIDSGSVFAATGDNQLVSLNAATGALNWQAPIVNGVIGSIVNYTGPEATPLVFNHRIMVGETVGDNGARGLVRAFNETNGALLWTFYTVPPSPITSTNQAFWHNSWATNGTSGCICGGGAVWNVPAVDPQTGIIYFGTGNPFPTIGPGTLIRSPNPTFSNLYTDSVVAVNSTDGSLVWYFQELPGDQKDHDQGMPIQLFTTTINGVPTEVVGAGGKLGYYYELDAKTGTLIHKIGVGIHLNELGTSPGIIYPGAGQGGINTLSSYNPTTNMIYTEANNNPDGCGTSCPAANSTLYAINAGTGKVQWTYNSTGLASGVSSTNTVVFTSNNHFFYALDALTGAVLWKFMEASGGTVGPWFSWGPPSVTDGKVFWTTLGTSTTGRLEAFSIQQVSTGSVKVSLTLNSDATSSPISSTNFFMLSYTSMGAPASAHLTGGTQVFQANPNSSMIISGKSSGSVSTERWCLIKTCQAISFSTGPSGGSFTFVYYDALKQTVSDSVLGGGTPKVKLTYSAIPTIAGPSDIPSILLATLSSTAKNIWVVRGTTASVPSNVTSPITPGERWLDESPTSWLISVALVITNPVIYQNQYQITLSSTPLGHGSTVPTGTAWYNAGATIAISARPNPGFSFTSWLSTNGGAVPIANTSASSTTATVDGSGSIIAQFT